MGTESTYYPSALTIAGSDSGGGAGIQADLRTFSAFGVFGCSAITAVTAQNPKHVSGVTTLTPEMVTAQMEMVCNSISIRAVKTGMLSSKPIISAVAAFLKKNNFTLVVDPVMISTSGIKLMDNDAIEVLKKELLPLASWVTPNIPEAEVLLGEKIETEDERIKAALLISEKWDCSCILKGGHAEAINDEMIDIVAHNGKCLRLSSPFIANSPATHGTGCTFSAALTALLAMDFHWKKALSSAKSFLFGSLAEAVPVGEDCVAMYPPMDTYLQDVSLKKI
jgi:hydroxymethylpyrimidine/phosphomethylpyrimidine kinase